MEDGKRNKWFKLCFITQTWIALLTGCAGSIVSSSHYGPAKSYSKWFVWYWTIAENILWTSNNLCVYSVLWLNIMPFRNMLLAIFTQIGYLLGLFTQIRKKFQKNTRSDMKIQKYSSIQVFRNSSIKILKFASITSIASISSIASIASIASTSSVDIIIISQVFKFWRVWLATY